MRIDCSDLGRLPVAEVLPGLTRDSVVRPDGTGETVDVVKGWGGVGVGWGVICGKRRVVVGGAEMLPGLARASGVRPGGAGEAVTGGEGVGHVRAARRHTQPQPNALLALCCRCCPPLLLLPAVFTAIPRWPPPSRRVVIVLHTLEVK